MEFNNRRLTKVYIVKCELVKFMVEIRWCDSAGQEARELTSKMSKDNLFQVNQYDSTGNWRVDFVLSSKATPLRPQWHKRRKATWPKCLFQSHIDTMFGIRRWLLAFSTGFWWLLFRGHQSDTMGLPSHHHGFFLLEQFPYCWQAVMGCLIGGYLDSD